MLSHAVVSQYRRDGYYAPLRVLDAAEAHAMRAELEAFEAKRREPFEGSVRFKGHLVLRWLAELVRSPRLLDAVEDLIGPDILCWTSQWWIAGPRSPQAVYCHQENPYWALNTDNLVSAWVALSPAAVESGCMRCIPGSHLGLDLPHSDTWKEKDVATWGQDTGGEVDEDSVVDIELGAGEAALFAYGIVHGSYPNRSDERRLAVAIRYVPPSARRTRFDWRSASLVRGKDYHRHFEHEPMPSCDFDPATVEFHRYAEEQHRRMLLQGTGSTEQRI